MIDFDQLSYSLLKKIKHIRIGYISSITDPKKELWIFPRANAYGPTIVILGKEWGQEKGIKISIDNDVYYDMTINEENLIRFIQGTIKLHSDFTLP